jgi:hypothetical protein
LQPDEVKKLGDRIAGIVAAIQFYAEEFANADNFNGKQVVAERIAAEHRALLALLPVSDEVINDEMRRGCELVIKACDVIINAPDGPRLGRPHRREVKRLMRAGQSHLDRAFGRLDVLTNA